MTLRPPEPDPRFWILSEALASYASGLDDPPPPDPSYLQAAVSLVIRGAPTLEILVIKRARAEGDPWSGHMALPGGRRDPGDGSLEETAIRETLEETGLDLAALGFPLGRLDELRPESVHLPRLTIAPFVWGVPPRAEASAASREVEAVHWIPLDRLRSPDTHGTVKIPLPNGTRVAFPCYHLADDVVWGLTYRILQDFLALYPPGAPDVTCPDPPPTRR